MIILVQGKVLTLDVNMDFLVTGSEKVNNEPGSIIVRDKATQRVHIELKPHVGSVVAVLLFKPRDGNSNLLITRGNHFRDFSAALLMTFLYRK